MSQPQKGLKGGRKTGGALARCHVMRQRAFALVAQGHTQTYAAEQVGCDPGTLSRWLKAHAREYETIVQQMTADAVGVLRRGASTAANQLVKLAQEGDRQACIAILDRVGIGAKQTIEHEGGVDTGYHVKPETMKEQLLEALEALGKQNEA